MREYTKGTTRARTHFCLAQLNLTYRCTRAVGTAISQPTAVKSLRQLVVQLDSTDQHTSSQVFTCKQFNRGVGLILGGRVLQFHLHYRLAPYTFDGYTNRLLIRSNLRQTENSINGGIITQTLGPNGRGLLLHRRGGRGRTPYNLQLGDGISGHDPTTVGIASLDDARHHGNAQPILPTAGQLQQFNAQSSRSTNVKF